MARSVISLSDPVTRMTHTYEGVQLEDLMHGLAVGTELHTVEISFDRRPRLRLSASNLDRSVQPLIVDTLDGKKLTGYVPYALVVKTHEGPPMSLTGVQCITIGRTR
jgi:hypothetical protein